MRVVEEIIGRLPTLTESQLGRLEDELRRERQRRASSEGGGEGAPQIHEGTSPPLTEVLEYCPHEDSYLQLELRRYLRRDWSTRERGPYWYFQFHEGGKRRKLYLGKTSNPQSTRTPRECKRMRRSFWKAYSSPLSVHRMTRNNPKTPRRSSSRSPARIPRFIRSTWGQILRRTPSLK